MFTLEQIEEIHRKLQLFGVKDKDLPILTEQLNGNEIITVVKDGRNVQLLISQLLDFNSFTPEQLESLRGPQGLDGKNAYQTWLAQGNVGTYDDYLTILQLPALTASETLIITVNNKLDEADDVIIKLNNKNEEMQQVISEATIAKDLAQEVVTHPPAIISGYWHLWNHVTNQYDTTYVKAAGDTAYEIWLAEGNTGTLEDFLADIKGDPFTYSDFTPEQLEALKVKGDPFLYEDFTPEQIAELQRPATDAVVAVNEAEALRVTAETTRVENEQGRDTAEGLRVAEEYNRHDNETGRQTAEGLRVLAEDTRQGNEQTRQDAEDGRDAAETIRQTNTAIAITNANNAATNANTKAGLADTAATLAIEVAEHPDTIVNDYWQKWNTTTNAYENTGIKAKGDTGKSAYQIYTEQTTDNPVLTETQWGNIYGTKENTVNKQNSLEVDGTGTKFPTVDAVNAGLQPKLVSGTNIKTVNGESLLGSGDLAVSGGSSVNVVQTTGTSETNVMSQKAVTTIADLVPALQPLQTVTNKNQYYPIIENNAGTIVGKHQTAFWNGTAWVGDNSLGFGNGSLQNNTGGGSNGFGNNSLQNNTGYGSSGFGNNSLQNNTGVDSNGFGAYSLYNNTGPGALGFGTSSLSYNTGGYSNGFGVSSLSYNTGGGSNGFGKSSLEKNTGGYSNGFGANSLRYNQAAYNTAIGDNSYAAFLDNTAGNKTAASSAVDITLERITLTAHGFGATNSIVNIKYASTTGTAIGGLSVGNVYQVKIIDANTVEFVSGSTKINLTSQGTGNHTFTPQLAYTNTTCLGANTTPNRSNQVVLGSTAVDTIRMGGTNRTPASATETGEKGEMCWDANYIYVCVATNTWKRATLVTW